MKYSLTTTAKVVVQPASTDRRMRFSAGNFSTAVAVYLRFPGTQNVLLILSASGTTTDMLLVPANATLEAYTDAGTADLAVTKETCPTLI